MRDNVARGRGRWYNRNGIVRGGGGVEKDAVTLRVARPQDGPALLEIYRPYVEETAISFETETPTAEEFPGGFSGLWRSTPTWWPSGAGSFWATPI